MRSLVILVVAIAISTAITAQVDRVSVLATVGLATPILDSGVGVHVGANPSLRLTNRLSAEGQLSYLYTRIDDTFLSGNVGSSHAINTLAGGRWYLNGADSKNRLFVNLLCGLNYYSEQIAGKERSTAFDIGLSTGVYLSRSRLTMGISFDSPQYLILKAGYSL